MAGDTTDAPAAPPSHYERLGGAAAIQRAVELFYDRVLADDELAPYFTGTDMPSLRRHQVLLLSQVLGGPASYDGRALAEAHQGLRITGAHYDRVVDHLVGVLTELGADDDALAAAGAVVAAVRPDIVAGGGAGS
ncbi:MAG TPA: group 1 truncated hemoglobin [Acidimicrobiales bacterium]